MKKRTLCKIRIISILFFLLLTVTVSYNKFNTESDFITREYIYTVVSNDSLWSIAMEYNFNNQDIRQVIHEIKTLNDIDANIHPGQVILIPIKTTLKDYERYEYLNAMSSN